MPRRVSRSEAARARATRPSRALAAAGVRPRRSAGQNFLTDKAIAERIVARAAIDPEDEVVEIGPGLGILTDRIATRALRRLTVIELDPRLARAISARFAGDRRVRVIEGDFLKVSARALDAASPAKVIGNLPFSAAGAILRRLGDSHGAIARMVLMFQREVGERIRARPGTPPYSALTVFTALYWEIDFHFRVAAGSFHPRPRVEAEVLGLRPRAPLFEAAEERAVLAAVRASFAAPRKTIRNSLLISLGLEAQALSRALTAARIDPDARAGTLKVEDFVRLARALGPPAETRRDA